MESKSSDTITRLAVCAVMAAGLVYGAEQLCEGKKYPLWEKYGPWIKANKVQATAIAAAALYVLSLALWPDALPGTKPPADDGFTPCE